VEYKKKGRLGIGEGAKKEASEVRAQTGEKKKGMGKTVW